MRAAFAAAALTLAVPAWAQQVPAIQTSAAASASVQLAAANPANLQPAGNRQVVVPPGMPPKPQLLSPDPVLQGKDHAAAVAGAAWRNKAERPIRGADGSVTWTYGLSLPTIVCAPLQACDLALEPGENANSIQAGDSVRWKVSAAVSGAGDGRTYHVLIKPIDSGLVSSLQIYTDRRVYSIKLVSTQSQWTPKTSFAYPGGDDAASIQQASEQMRGPAVARGGSVNAGNLTFLRIGGDLPSWRPLHAYSDGRKTYIDFPGRIETMSAPVLMMVAHDGGLFSSPTEEIITYRVLDHRMIVDRVLDKALLVRGAGGSREKVTLEKGS